MSKQLMQILCLTLSILFIRSTYSLRCAHDCLVIDIKFGEQHPFKHPCKTIDVDGHSTVCSVFLTVNYNEKVMSGVLTKVPAKMDGPSTLSVKSDLYPRALTTFISYHCSHKDDCDQEFVRQTIGSNQWSQLNLTALHDDLIALLYKEESTENTTCDNHLICEPFGLCNAELILNKSVSRPNQYTFNNKFPCDLQSENQVKYDEWFSEVFDNSHTSIKVFCNKDKCNNEQIVRQVQNLIQQNFKLPFDYSRYTPKNYAYRRNHFLSLSVLFFHTLYTFFDVLNI